MDITEALTVREGNVLVELASQVAQDVMVEVGSWKGHSASFIGKVAKEKNCLLFCVDHWKGTPGSIFHHLEVDCYSKFRTNMKELELEDFVHPLVMESALAAKIFKDGIADFVFIDADHRYEQVKFDIEGWWPKVRKGGILCGHDCTDYWKNYTPEQHNLMDASWNNDYITEFHTHPGVVKALEVVFGAEFSIYPKTTIWYKKKE